MFWKNHRYIRRSQPHQFAEQGGLALGGPEQMVQVKVLSVDGIGGDFIHQAFRRIFSPQETENKIVKSICFFQRDESAFLQDGVQTFGGNGIVLLPDMMTEKQKKTDQGGTVDIQRALDIFADGGLPESVDFAVGFFIQAAVESQRKKFFVR